MMAVSRRLSSVLSAHVILLLLLTGSTLGCGPGRGPGRRRGVRIKVTPLVFKQHVPNVSENTLGASGQPEGKIRRNDQKFKDLVTNDNTDIIFKDEEGTGADHKMTQRCKDKLNTLAIAVMNQWPGVKLRVTEAWDEDDHHSKDSLHYEGRAVDITTSDRDRTKYGMLARLAQDAGFDWVYYESRGHIHCSVKSDSSIAVKTGGCFPGDSEVKSEGSIRRMSELSVGDKVQAALPDGSLTYTDVMAFIHKENNTVYEFITIETSSGETLSLTPSHLMYVSDTPHTDHTNVQAVFASSVHPGQYVYTSQDGRLLPVRIAEVYTQRLTGVYAPLTRHGTLMVDSVSVSCYAQVESQWLTHTVLAPVRWYYDVTSWLHRGSSHNQSEDGILWYAQILHALGAIVVPKDIWYQS